MDEDSTKWKAMDNADRARLDGYVRAAMMAVPADRASYLYKVHAERAVDLAWEAMRRTDQRVAWWNAKGASELDSSKDPLYGASWW